MVSEKNTKAEICKEYEELLKKVKREKGCIPGDIDNLSTRDTKSQLLDAVEKLNDVLNDKEIEVSDEVISDINELEDDIISGKQVDSLDNHVDNRFTIGRNIDILSDEIVEKIFAVEETVNMKREELQCIKALEKELSSFVDLINKDRMQFFTDSLNNKKIIEDMKKSFEKQIEQISVECELQVEKANEKLEELKNSIELKKKERDELRVKEKEQYEYDLKMQQSREDDAWEDRKAKKLGIIKSLGDNIETLRGELKEKEKMVPKLQEDLDKIPELIEQAEKEGALEKHEELETEIIIK